MRNQNIISFVMLIAISVSIAAGIYVYVSHSSQKIAEYQKLVEEYDKLKNIQIGGAITQMFGSYLAFMVTNPSDYNVNLSLLGFSFRNLKTGSYFQKTYLEYGKDYFAYPSGEILEPGQRKLILISLRDADVNELGKDYEATLYYGSQFLTIQPELKPFYKIYLDYEPYYDPLQKQSYLKVHAKVIRSNNGQPYANQPINLRLMQYNTGYVTYDNNLTTNSTGEITVMMPWNFSSLLPGQIWSLEFDYYNEVQSCSAKYPQWKLVYDQGDNHYEKDSQWIWIKFCDRDKIWVNHTLVPYYVDSNWINFTANFSFELKEVPTHEHFFVQIPMHTTKLLEDGGRAIIVCNNNSLFDCYVSSASFNLTSWSLEDQILNEYSDSLDISPIRVYNPLPHPVIVHVFYYLYRYDPSSNTWQKFWWTGSGFPGESLLIQPKSYSNLTLKYNLTKITQMVSEVLPDLGKNGSYKICIQTSWWQHSDRTYQRCYLFHINSKDFSGTFNSEIFQIPYAGVVAVYKGGSITQGNYYVSFNISFKRYSSGSYVEEMGSLWPIFYDSSGWWTYYSAWQHGYSTANTEYYRSWRVVVPGNDIEDINNLVMTFNIFVKNLEYDSSQNLYKINATARIWLINAGKSRIDNLKIYRRRLIQRSYGTKSFNPCTKTFWSIIYNNSKPQHDEIFHAILNFAIFDVSVNGVWDAYAHLPNFTVLINGKEYGTFWRDSLGNVYDNTGGRCEKGYQGITDMIVKCKGFRSYDYIDDLVSENDTYINVTFIGNQNCGRMQITGYFGGVSIGNIFDQVKELFNSKDPYVVEVSILNPDPNLTSTKYMELIWT